GQPDREHVGQEERPRGHRDEGGDVRRGRAGDPHRGQDVPEDRRRHRRQDQDELPDGDAPDLQAGPAGGERSFVGRAHGEAPVRLGERVAGAVPVAVRVGPGVGVGPAVTVPPAHPTFEVLHRSVRTCSTMAMASSLLRAEIPSESPCHSGNASAWLAGRSVGVSTWDRWTPANDTGTPLNTATFPSETPTYHCRPTYARTPAYAPASRSASTTRATTSLRRRCGARWSSEAGSMGRAPSGP